MAPLHTAARQSQSWRRRLCHQHQAYADGTHVSNYFSLKSPNAHSSPSEGNKSIDVVSEKVYNSGHDGGEGSASVYEGIRRGESGTRQLRRLQRDSSGSGEENPSTSR